MIHASGTGFAAELTLGCGEGRSRPPNKRKRPPGRIGGRFWPARGLESGQSPADATMV
ncbi:MAG TPA: hypothetical protein VGP28_03975 [Methylocella sp.]|nr:hypothetical protein [Methylocella sp.]